MLKYPPENVWTKQVCFYLDASSFVHKTNSFNQARVPGAKVWRKKNEGLSIGCTSKERKQVAAARLHISWCVYHMERECIFASSMIKWTAHISPNLLQGLF
jgi:hypothetical protein